MIKDPALWYFLTLAVGAGIGWIARIMYDNWKSKKVSK